LDCVLLLLVTGLCRRLPVAEASCENVARDPAAIANARMIRSDDFMVTSLSPLFWNRGGKEISTIY
jgi:hypothetical protein